MKTFAIASLWMIIFSTSVLAQDQDAVISTTSSPTSLRTALKLKKNLYRSEGATVGGVPTVNQFTVNNLRVGTHGQDYDRVVVETQFPSQGAQQQAPSFHVEVNSNTHTTVVTLYGHAQLAFNTKLVQNQIKKTKWIQKIQLMPVVDQDRWIFSIDTTPGTEVEVFELSQPGRIILDFKK